MTIHWNRIPKYEIDGSKLTSPYTVCNILSHYEIDKYLYRIVYKGIVIKYGMSADHSRNYGERLYRQIGHSASWGPTLRLRGHSGADWRVIEEDFKNLYGFEIDIQHCTITVWDITNYPFQTVNSREEILAMESTLITEYEKVVGQKPIGNINDDAWYLEKAYIKKETFGNLFEGYEELVK
jgi:hypothetical protein